MSTLSTFNSSDVLETISMIRDNNLDIRTNTMGISLLDCADSDISKSCDKIYEKICRLAGNLVEAADKTARKYGIPIVNKRVSVTPIATLAGISGGDPVLYAKALDKAAHTIGVDFVGGYSALVHKGFSAGDKALIESIPQALAETDLVCSSVNIGSTKAGINMDAVRLMGQQVLEASRLTADRQCIGAAKLVVFCNAVEDNPFMAGAFHGFGEADTVLSVGVSGPGVVRSVLADMPKDAPLQDVAEAIKKTAFKITRVGQLVGSEVAAELGVQFGIVDLSLAPTPAIGDSVAYILEEIGLEQCGTHGTTAGLDMIVIPGDTSADVISAIIADEAAIGMVNSKTTAVRVIPAVGLKEGEELNFGGLLGYGPVMPVRTKSPSVMIQRGGRIPAPLQSLKN